MHTGKRSSTVIAVLVALALSAPWSVAPAWATSVEERGRALRGSAGTLDPSFGDGGVVLTDVGEWAEGAAVLVMEDGVAVGFYGNPNDGVVKYRADGSLDPSFADEGILTLGHRVRTVPLSLMNGPRHTLLVLYGSSLERRLPDGNLDMSFGSGGRVDVRPGVYRQGVRLPDGRILLVGDTKHGDLAVLRLTGEGDPDPAFGDHGRVVVDLGSGNDRGVGIDVLPNGRLVVAASLVYCRPDCLDDFGSLVRLEADGSVDRTFGTGGTVSWRTGSGSVLPSAMALSSHGDIVVFVSPFTIGEWGCPTVGAASTYVVRFHRDGTRDRAFGHLGRAPVPLIPAVAFAMQPDDRMLFAGWEAQTCDATNLAMVRLSQDGSLDSTFGDGGLASAEILGRDSVATAISVQPDGKIVVAGVQEWLGAEPPVEPLPLIVTRYLGS